MPHTRHKTWDMVKHGWDWSRDLQFTTTSLERNYQWATPMRAVSHCIIFFINDNNYTTATPNCIVFMSFFCVIDPWIFCKFFLGPHITVTQISYGIRAMAGQGNSSSTDFLLDLLCNLIKNLKTNSSSAPEAESLPHNSWNPNLLDQACLIH